MRKKLTIFAATALAATLTACSGASTGNDAVVFGTLGGEGEEAIDTAWSQDFTAETGIDVVYDSPATMAKALQMVGSNAVTWDIFMQRLMATADDNPEFEDIDCDVVPCEEF